MRAVGLAAFTLLMGCGSDSVSGPEGEGGSPPDPEAPCAVDERVLDDGSCLPPGIPDGACAEGFLYEPEDRRCVPVLPDEACADGMMAVPGEADCRPIAPCGVAKWGDIPREPNTQHVDASYAGGASDGSADHPHTTIGAAVAVAEPGAIVAIAAGSYPEYLWLEGKALRFWGACPTEVEWVAQLGEQTTVFVAENAHGTEFHDLAVTGPAYGIAVSGSLDVVVDRVWFHDLGGPGLFTQSVVAPSRVSVTGSLFERTGGTGAVALGAELRIEASVFRDGVASASFGGRGITLQADEGVRGRLDVVGSLVEDSGEWGIGVFGADAEVDASVVRRMRPMPDGSSGIGIGAAAASTIPGPPVLSVRRSVVDEALYGGIRCTGGELTVEHTVVSRTAIGMSSDGVVSGSAILTTDELGFEGTANVVESTLVDNEMWGVTVSSATATIEGTRIARTRFDGDVAAGGIKLLSPADALARGVAGVRWSRLEGNAVAGIVTAAGDLTFENSRVLGTQPSTSGFHGHGLHFQPLDGAGSTAAIRSAEIVGAHQLGISFSGGELSVTDTLVADILPGLLSHGDALMVVTFEGVPGSAVLDGFRAVRPSRVGVASFGAQVQLGDTSIECAAIDLNGEVFDEQAFGFEDVGGNDCSCDGESHECKVISSGFMPNPPITP